MNRAKDLLIVVLALAVVYLLATRSGIDEPTQTEPPVVAVLPFVNMSSDASNEYLSDSIWDDTIFELATDSEFRVVSRTTSAKYKGSKEEIELIGNALGAHYVVEGAVQQSGGSLKITARLIRVSDGAHLWVETYAVSADSAATMPQRIARSISEQIDRI